MKPKLPCVLALLIAASGCQSVATMSPSPYDELAIARIERAAQSAGVRVIWVNPPLKKALQDPRPGG